MELTVDQVLQKGVKAHREGKLQDAERFYQAIIQSQPLHSDANHNMGLLAVGIGKVEEALPFFKIALEANPSVGQFWLSYIDALKNNGELIEAEIMLERAKKIGGKGKAFEELRKRPQIATHAESPKTEHNFPRS